MSGRRTFLALIVLSSALLPQSAANASALPRGNLVRNGGFEANAGDDGSAQVVPSMWKEVSNPLDSPTATVVSYAQGTVSNYPGPNIGDLIAGRNNFLAGSAASQGTPTSAVVQRVDVPSSAVGAVDTGKVHVAMSADLGGWGAQDDRADVLLQFLNGGSQVIGSSVQITGPTAAARSGSTGFVFVEDSPIVPRHTRGFRLEIFMSRLSDTTSSMTTNDGYVDNVRLEFGVTPHSVRALRDTSYVPTTLSGVLGSAYNVCGINQNVTLVQHRSSGDRVIDTTTTDVGQGWSFDIPHGGTYFVTAAASATGYLCLATRSAFLHFTD